MAKYVSLSDATGTGHAGSIGDPYSYVDWQVSVDGTNSETYYIKGSKDATGGAEFLTFSAGSVNHQFLPWDLATNGPWRVRPSNPSLHLNGTFQNGIIVVEVPCSAGWGDVTNCNFISSELHMLTSSYTDGYIGCSSGGFIKGSTIIVHTMYGSGDDGLEVTDSLIDIQDWAPPI